MVLTELVPLFDSSTKSSIVYIFIVPLIEHRHLIVQYIFLYIWDIAAIQYCVKVMQTNFDWIPGFSKKFCLKQYFDEISPHFRDTYCFDLRDFSNDNSLLPKIRSIVYQ